jgi:hypothetical protein
VTEEKQGINLAAWRESLYFNEVLPSGLAVKMKRVSLLDLAAVGGVPEPLLALATGKKAEMEFTGEALQEVLKAFDTTAMACLVEPPAKEGESSDTHVGLSDLHYEDKEFIFERANEGVMKIAPFRKE